MAKATVTITGLDVIRKKIDQIDWSKVIQEAIYMTVHAEDIEVEKTYKEFWKGIIENDGEVDMEQVKKELHDFHTLMGNVVEVYCHITGNQISKPMTDPTIVCNLADDYYDGICKEYCKDIEEPE